MTKSAFCAACARSVYVSDGDDEVCPVCSSPLAGIDPERADERLTSREDPARQE